MQKPPFPSNEAERLFSLQKMELLDTPFEERFDRITRTAQQMFDVDICLISIVDSKRQWFKSIQGVDARETPREISFCGHTILQDEIMVIENALEDPRFSDNPLVVGDPNIRFYAGCPIQSPDGYPIGTLCLIDSKPRTLSTKDAGLRDLAAMVEDCFRPSPDAVVDRVTQLVNRYGFEMIARQFLSVCVREKLEAQILFFELDCKDEGQLQLFARVLCATFRESDVIARFETGEFGALILGTANIDDVLDRLRRTSKVACVAQEMKLDWSVGIAQFDPSETELNTMLVEANKRMEADKRARGV